MIWIKLIQSIDDAHFTSKFNVRNEVLSIVLNLNNDEALQDADSSQYSVKFILNL